MGMKRFHIIRLFISKQIVVDGKLKSRYKLAGFHAISGDTNNSGEMNKCWWTNKAS